MKVKCTDFYGKVHLIDEDKLIDRLSVYGVYYTGSAVLLIQDPRSLRWELPGGGVEKGETVQAALSREFKEETGLSIIGGIEPLTEWIEYYFDVTAQEAWRSLRKFYIVDKIEGKILENGNHDDSAAAKLVNLSDIEDMSMTKSIYRVIELASSRIIRPD